MGSSGGLVCLTGGTGYIGGRLLSLLEDRGLSVLCLARRPEALENRVGTNTEIVRADVLDRDSLSAAMRGVDVAYYLVHSMGSGEDFDQRDRLGALNFVDAARECGVKRIIYLGGLGDASTKLSKHLRSRQEVGEILRGSGLQVIEFRASIIIGSGSLSFELIRALVERLPIMVCPKWVETKAQPIAVEDVLDYLLCAFDFPESESRIFEIGGPDRVSYGEVMREYARQRGLGRLMIPVPVLTPYLSSLWLGLVTPVYARIGRKLIEGMMNPTVVRDPSALETFPVRPRGLRASIQRAIANEDMEFAKTRWSDALSSAREPPHWGGQRFGSRIVDSRYVDVEVSVEDAFEPIRKIGGNTGWYYGKWLWDLRGFLDLMVGGVGVRRGRRDPANIHPGDAIDFWRVEAVEPPRRLRLIAEMRLPGRVWHELEVSEREQGARIRQTATFDPVGLAGLGYWYALYPLHRMLFAGMLRGLGRAAEMQGKKKLDG